MEVPINRAVGGSKLAIILAELFPCGVVFLTPPTIGKKLLFFDRLQWAK
ncbi:hypothetical protein [Mannheimia indoligenes]